MFGVTSLSTYLLVALYGWGFVVMTKAARNAGQSWSAAVSWAAVWPVSAWKVLNDLWRSPPPVG